jgi:hypothetical protein
MEFDLSQASLQWRDRLQAFFDKIFKMETPPPWTIANSPYLLPRPA